MTELNSVDEILDFAIGEEQAAHDFYMAVAKKLDKPAMRKVFEGFAKEEAGHKAKLEAVKGGKKLLSNAGKVTDLKIGDYLVDVSAEGELADLDYQKALIVAMKKEKAAFRLYSDLAGKVDGDVKELLLGLAQEEAKHKLRFEVEYDEVILAEN
jgi:rubrerythrin